MSNAVEVNCSNAAPVVASACNLAEAAARLRAAVSKSLCEVADYLTSQVAPVVIPTLKDDASSLTERQHPVKLNVGGVRFETSVATLRSQPGSYFDGLLSDRWNSQVIPDKEIFIDRDGSLFRHVLKFLRTGTLHVHQLTHEEVVDLKIEADFFGLPRLAACFIVRLPELAFSHIDRCVVVEKEGRVLKPCDIKVASGVLFHFATAAPALPEFKITLLQLIVRSVQHLGVFIGVSQDPRPRCHLQGSSPGLFGWFEGRLVWSDNEENGRCADDVRFQDGDVVVLKVDRDKALLSMRFKRLARNRTLTISGIPTSGPLYLSVGFSRYMSRGSSVELQPELDLELLFWHL